MTIDNDYNVIMQLLLINYSTLASYAQMLLN